MGEGDHANHRDEFIANAASRRSRSATMFLRAAAPAVDAGVDVGLVQMSSASARIVYPGYAIYGASKAAIEQWVRCVRAERERPREGAVGGRDPPGLRRHPGGST